MYSMWKGTSRIIPVFQIPVHCSTHVRVLLGSQGPVSKSEAVPFRVIMLLASSARQASMCCSWHCEPHSWCKMIALVSLLWWELALSENRLATLQGRIATDMPTPCRPSHHKAECTTSYCSNRHAKAQTTVVHRVSPKIV